MIGIIGAMQSEIEDLKSSLVIIESKEISSIEFIRAKLNDIDCVVAVSGVGKVNSAVCTQIMIMEYNPDMIINVGVAGGVAEGIKICDIVISDFIMQHDMDTSGLGDAKGLISGINLVKIPCDNNLVSVVKAAADKIKLKSHIGTIMSGDQFINDKEKLKDLRKMFGGIACDMESGSIGQVCYLNKVKFVAIRSISDNANSDSNVDYNKFLELAVKNTHNLLFEIFMILKNKI